VKTLLAIMLVGCVSNAPDDIDSSQASPSNAGSSSNGATTPPTQPPCRHYHIEEIPPLVAGETTTAARALCSSGAVVGAASLSSSSSHAVVYKADQVTDLGTLGGDYSRADDGNAQGTIVGLAQIASGLSRAFVYRDGAMTELAGIGGSYAEAFAINDGDEIAGTGNIPANGGGSDTNSHALLWEPGDSDPIDLTVLNGGNYSFARDINAAGDVVGTDIPLDSHTGRAVVWHDPAKV
jgi:probable HAF family extracellular repeat protein